MSTGVDADIEFDCPSPTGDLVPEVGPLETDDVVAAIGADVVADPFSGVAPGVVADPFSGVAPGVVADPFSGVAPDVVADVPPDVSAELGSVPLWSVLLCPNVAVLWMGTAVPWGIAVLFWF